MKAYAKIVFLYLLAAGLLFLTVNLYLNHSTISSARPYLVEAERITQLLSQMNYDPSLISLDPYPSIIQVSRIDPANLKASLEGGNNYMIKETGGHYFRFDYQISLQPFLQKLCLTVNLALGTMTLFSGVLLLVLYLKLLKPFQRMEEVPLELSKGNLVIPIRESKSRFWGRFFWGMDRLREQLELQRAKELQLQKDKKTLILSISHDIKTPLSAIKLYAAALSRDLYNTPQKQHDIAENIQRQVSDIERFISQIMLASTEDFLNLEVDNQEFYLSQLIESIRLYYKEKLSLLGISFTVGICPDCMLKGNLDRGIEVLQNLIENSIKYGDGRMIRLDCSDEEDCRLVSITNSGCTLADHELPYLFDSFWRGSNTGSSNGSGLGLFICRQLMLKMDGDIYACIKNNPHDESNSALNVSVMEVTAVFRRV